MDFQVEARSRNFPVSKTSVAAVGRTLPTVRLLLDAYRFYSLFVIYDPSFCFFFFVLEKRIYFASVRIVYYFSKL